MCRSCSESPEVDSHIAWWMPVSPGLLTCVAVLLSLGLPLGAQDSAELTARGYVTDVESASAFDVNGQHVICGAQTSYGILGVNHSETNSPLAAKIQLGAYVEVTGVPDWHTKTLAATLIQLRDDDREKLLGMGVILKVHSSGAEPVYQADGYSLRITNATDKTFHGKLNSLADVQPGIWLRYAGARDGNGMVTAAKADFYRAKQKSGKSKNGSSEDGLEFVPPTYASDDGKTPGRDGKVHLGLTKRSHKVPADRSLQGRVQRVGERIVPAYQVALPDGDPSKLNFRFYAVDAPTVESTVATSQGLILVPRHIVERLQSDDELAAVLADGVALLMQSQIISSKVLEFEGVADIMKLGALPTGLGVLEVEAAHQAAIFQEEQRWRIELSLVADAGYDPWQAPEAWRVAVAKKLPKDIRSLKYPDVSGYELGILNLQYQKAQRKQTASNLTDQQSPR